MIETEKGAQVAGTNVPGSSLVRREVWRSLVSMLRVYAHAASLNYGEHAVSETGADVVTLAHQEATLEINFHPASGMAAWILRHQGRAETSGLFTMSDAGAIEFDGKEKELDRAAIEWIEELTRTAGAKRAL
jgi:hypothetical protein